MTEFYFWIKSDHTAPIDSFPLCVLYDTISDQKTDIALVIDTLNNPPNGGLFTIHMEDADSMHHNEVRIDSTDRWYKIQIYRHDGVVDFYLDGDSVATFSPMNSSYVSNKIVLGTTQADSLTDGEVFYDDVIISTSPSGDHPRLLFNSSFVDTIKSRASNSNSTPLGITYKEVADSLIEWADRYATNDTMITVEIPETTFYFYHPFEYPPKFYKSDSLGNMLIFNKLSSDIRHRLDRMSFAYIITDSALYRDKTCEILEALASWLQWVNPNLQHDNHSRYCFIETFLLTMASALAYDLLFDSLDSYSRISLQNTLLTLGIGALYLESLHGDLGSNLSQLGWGNPDGGNWANHYVNLNAALGFGSLLLEEEVDNGLVELDTARIRIDTLFVHREICDTAGGYVEGIHYAAYCLRNLFHFCIADSIGGETSRIDDYYWSVHPNFRVYAKVPGDNEDYAWDPGGFELDFCDSKSGSKGELTSHLLYMADKYNDSLVQYYLRYARDKLFHQYLLWMDATLAAVHPTGNMFGRRYPDIGWAVLRDGWCSSDYQIALRSGRNVGHTQYDNNTIILGTNNRWLITDAGYSSGEGDYEYMAVNHNVVIVQEDTVNEGDTTGTIPRFHIATDSSFGYVRGDASDSYDDFSKYVRDIVAVNTNDAPFLVINDGVKPAGDIDSLTWLFHTWGDALWDSVNQKVRIVDYQQGDFEYLDMTVLWPGSVKYDTDTINDEHGGDSTRTRIYLAKKYPVYPESMPSYEQFVAVLIPDHNNQPTTSASKIVGKGLIGTKVEKVAVLLGDHADSVPGGKYEISVDDSLLNIVCNLYPDTSYLVVKKKGSGDENIDTMQTNDVGVLSFELQGTGDWKVLITQARTTGSIKINNDNAYCNVPFVELNLAMTNPLDSQSVDSMRIWQKYLDPPETWNYDSTGWIPFDSTYFWYLRQGEGTNVIYAQLMADGWNESTEYCDSILYDTTTSTGSFVINNNDKFTKTSQVTIQNSLTDEASGMSKMRYGNKYLKNLIKNSAFDDTSDWVTDTALYHDSLRLFEMPVQTIGNYFYQSISPESLADFDNDTLLLWIDLVGNDFAGVGKVKFQYIYGLPTDTIDPKGQYPCGDSITIPQGTDARVSWCNLASYFKYHPTPPPNKYLLEARVGVFVDAGAGNAGTLFIDNLRLDVVSPYRDYSKFASYDSTENWILVSGNGIRKVYGQFADSAGNETGVLWDSIIVDTTRPEAVISSPVKEQILNGTVGITGYAFDYADPFQHFKEYSLYYKNSASQDEWFGVRPDSIFGDPVNPSIPPQELAEWDTKLVTEEHGDGWYYLRLLVSDLADNYRGDTVLVYIGNTQGEKGEIAGFSNDVYGLAAADEIFIGELGTGKIYRYDSLYQLLDTFALSDSLGIGLPLAMTLDNSGKLWVTNIVSHYVNRFTPQGNLLLQFAGGFSLPSGIALDEIDNEWISDRLHHRIKKFDSQGNLLFQFGTRGRDPGEIDRPIGIASFNGKIYIADSRNRRISIFDTLGTFVRIIGDSAGLIMPFGLVVDTTGCIFVSDAVGNEVIEFGPSGNRLFGIDSILDSPTGLALSSDMKTLYVSDTRNRRVLAFAVRDEPPLSGGGPQAMGEVDINKLSFDIFPSPFSSRLTIKLQGIAGHRLTLKFYDVTGILIKTFLDNDLVKYDQNIIWDGQDNQQRKCAAGVYFLRLEIGDYTDTKKTILMK